MPLKVIVTDGEQRAALATVRALGRAGHQVFVCGTDSGSISSASRYCTRSVTVPDPLRKSEDFVATVSLLEKEVGSNVLLPISEASLLAVLPNRDRFSSVIPFVAADVFERVCNKRLVLEAAQRLGFAVPRQWNLHSPQDVSRINGSFSYPLVLKPHSSVVGTQRERIHTSVQYAFDDRQVADILARMPVSAFPVLAQQHVDGPGFAISVLIWDGEPRAAFAHQRLREKPPSGGVSVLRKSIALDPDLLRGSLELLRHFGWQGVAMIEFKRDAVTGTPYLMEINGRFWGSLQLALDSGVDFPNLLVDAALGRESHRVTTYKIGVLSRWEWGDVDHLWAAMTHPKERLALSSQTRGQTAFTKLREFVQAFHGDNIPEIYRRDDPRPFLRETANWFRRR